MYGVVQISHYNPWRWELENIMCLLWPGDCEAVTGVTTSGGPWELRPELGSPDGLVFGEEGRRFVPPFVMIRLLHQSVFSFSRRQCQLWLARALLNIHGAIFKYSYNWGLGIGTLTRAWKYWPVSSELFSECANPPFYYSQERLMKFDSSAESIVQSTMTLFKL